MYVWPHMAILIQLPNKFISKSSIDDKYSILARMSIEFNSTLDILDIITQLEKK